MRANRSVVVAVLLLASLAGCPSSTGTVLDGGAAGSGPGGCVMPAGGPCDGTGASPCTCASGLTCAPGVGTGVAPTSGTCVVIDAGTTRPPPPPPPTAPGPACISPIGGPCAGEGAEPCTCASGLTCGQGDIGAPLSSLGVCQLP